MSCLPSHLNLSEYATGSWRQALQARQRSLFGYIALSYEFCFSSLRMRLEWAKIELRKQDASNSALIQRLKQERDHLTAEVCTYLLF